MDEASPDFYPIAIFVLVAILAVFAMKYAAAAYRSRLEAKRQMTENEVLAALRHDVRGLTARIDAVEKLLREVE